MSVKIEGEPAEIVLVTKTEDDLRAACRPDYPDGPCQPMARPCNPQCQPACLPSSLPRDCGPTRGDPRPPPPKPPKPN